MHKETKKFIQDWYNKEIERTDRIEMERQQKKIEEPNYYEQQLSLADAYVKQSGEQLNRSKELMDKMSGRTIGDVFDEAVANLHPEYRQQSERVDTGTQKSTPTDIYDGPTPYFDVTETGTTYTEAEQHSGDRVDHPEYYNLKDGPYIVHYSQKIPIECIDVIRDMPLWKGNVIKYLWRCGEKHEQGLSDTQKELEDMKKAAWYLNEKIKHMEMDIELETLHDLPEWNGSTNTIY